MQSTGGRLGTLRRYVGHPVASCIRLENKKPVKEHTSPVNWCILTLQNPEAMRHLTYQHGDEVGNGALLLLQRLSLLLHYSQHGANRSGVLEAALAFRHLDRLRKNKSNNDTESDQDSHIPGKTKRKLALRMFQRQMLQVQPPPLPNKHVKHMSHGCIIRDEDSELTDLCR